MTAFCPDTPENWKKFHKLKANLGKPSAAGVKKMKANEALQKQLSRENKHLRGLRRYLPGYEPDRYVL